MRFLTSPLLALALGSCVSSPPTVAESTTHRDAEAAEGAERATPDLPAPEAATPEVPAAQPPAVPDERDETRELAEAAKRAIDARDFARARAILDDLLTVPKVAEAWLLLASGRVEAALAITQVALNIAPSEPRVLLVHAEASLRLGVATAARERIEEALRTFLRAGTSAEAWLGASRAARELGRTGEALDHAREARKEIAARGVAGVHLAETPERTLAVACWNAFDALTGDALATPESAALAQETVDALAALRGVEGRNPWVHLRLADVHERNHQPDEALRELALGFETLPEDAEIRERLESVARAQSGSEGVIRAFETARVRVPRVASVWWIPALERFRNAVAKLAETPINDFRVAELEFSNARLRDSTLRAECLRYEALCRVAMGWCLLAAGDLSAAAKSFRSAEQVAKGSLEVSIEGSLAPAVAGLAAVSDAYAARGEYVAAATIAAELHAYQPESLEAAVRAGVAHRNQGEQSRLFASEYELASKRKISDPRRLQALRERAQIGREFSGSALDEEFSDKAASQRRRAQRSFEASYSAYLDAYRLGGEDDLRIMCDAAFVAIVYLNSELERATGLLRRAIALGESQLAAPDLDDAQRVRLRQAWGDAHEYLGVYYLEHKDDAKRALKHFEKSLEIGPVPRPSVEQSFVPRCRKLLGRDN